MTIWSIKRLNTSMQPKSVNNLLRCINQLETPPMTPLVTFITPTYNAAHFLPETIDSILVQTYPNIEYIVLDDGSTDNTVEILKSYGDRIMWESHPNMGETRTINKGYSMAKGD